MLTLYTEELRFSCSLQTCSCSVPKTNGYSAKISSGKVREWGGMEEKEKNEGGKEGGRERERESTDLHVSACECVMPCLQTQGWNLLTIC